MELEEIDWEEMWRRDQKKLTIPLSGTVTEEKFWDQVALLFRQRINTDDYPYKLLNRIPIKPEWSFLDIGCGNGAIAIATAIRAKSVTVIDISSKILENLKKEAEKKHLVNIRYLQRSWENTLLGADIEPHDVVIMSRSLSRIGDLVVSLMKIDKAALRYAYVTAWGGGERKFDRGLLEALGYEYHNRSESLYIFNILSRMGIRPHVEQIECRNTIQFPDLEEALRYYQFILEFPPAKIPVARRYLEENLIKREDGNLEVPDERPVWSLIWWKKEMR